MLKSHFEEISTDSGLSLSKNNQILCKNKTKYFS